MSEAFIGEIRLFGGNFAPVDWAFCDGSVLPISQNDALFALIGTTYGGDGQTTFALPDLRGRLPVHYGPGSRPVELRAGSDGRQRDRDAHLAAAPGAHARGAGAVRGGGPGWSRRRRLGGLGAEPILSQTRPIAAMSTAAIGATGGSQQHDNMAPYQVVSFIICLFGIFPSRN